MDVNWIITAILGIVVIYFFYYVIKKKLNYWKDRGVPEIKSKIMTSLFLGKKSFNDVMIENYEAMEGKKFAAYPPIFRKTVLVRDQELINHILIKDFTYFEDRNYVTEGQGMTDEGITVLTGEKWRYLRHRLTPTFTSGKLKMMFDSMKECCDELVLYVKDKTGEDIEGKRLMFKCILNMIGSVAFGIKINALTDDEESVEFLKLSDKFFKPSAFKFMKFMVLSLVPNWVLKTFRIRFIDSEIDNFFRSLVKDIIAQRERTGTRRNDFLQLMLDQKKKESENSQQDKKNNHTHENESDELEPGDKVLLDQLKFMGSGKENEHKYKNMLNEDCIAAQSFIFISGGSETIASALSFVLYDLAVHPDLQRKVQDEIDRVLSKEKFSYQAVKNMTYMDRFIQEAMRQFPIPALLRMCTKDYKIPGTDVILEKGTFITIPVAGLHNDPQYFPEPEKFNPDRFENPDAVPKGVYFPFGSGPRMCIAMRLAFLQMKIILATLLSTYNITLSKKTKLPLKIQTMSTVIAAEGGIWLKFEERTKTK